MHNLRSKLLRLNKCKYNLYNSLHGRYEFEGFSLHVDYVQPDPFAPPSKMTLIVPFGNTGFNEELISTPVREYSFCDAVGRTFAKLARKMTKDDKGSGNGGFCGIRYGAQKVIEGNSVRINNGNIELKILMGLPAFGRTIAGKEALQFLLDELPALVNAALLDTRDKNEEFLDFVTLTERQHWLRDECRQRGLVAFIANGSILARASSVNDKPMSHQKAIAFESPKELHTSITLPDGFKIHGMGIPKGITLIAGGGFHGKSTLLSAISHAIYNHIPEDGREFCVTDDTAVFLRAEEGRFVEGVDISPFIHNLPDYKSSTSFQTENASGSSSQATNLMEALEVGSKLILIDEDISATNFLVRDTRMRELVPDYKETITPLIAHMQNLKNQDVSLIMVTGALGDFMSIADRVIVAENYHYHDATNAAKEIVARNPVTKISADPFDFQSKRIIDADSINYVGKKGMAFIEGSENEIKFGRETIDMSLWTQLYDFSQYGTIAAVLAYAKQKNYFDQSPDKIWQRVQDDVDRLGWEIFENIGFDHLSPRQEARQGKQHADKSNAKPWRYIVKTRPLDWHAALSRLRSLKCKGKTDEI